MKKNICYIPLDNRPVVYKRMILLSKATDINLLIPDNDIVLTALDNQPLSQSNLNHGDVSRLKEWYQDLDHKQIDGYVICSDQMLFGGLVNSRFSLTPAFKEAKKLIDFFLNDSFIQNKPVILIDSLMRLASTACYCNYNLTEYNNIRNYGLHSRYVLKDDFTINDIFACYEKDLDNHDIDFTHYGLTLEMKNRYLENRKNKFLINDYLVDYANKHNNVYFMLGIDDSNPTITIQSNEINYLRKRLVNGIVFTGIDELPLMGLTRLVMKFNMDRKVNLNISYYGGMQYIPGDPYDNGTIEECVNYHLEALNVKYDKDGDIFVLMLTFNEKSNQEDINNLINDAFTLINKRKKVIVLDGSGFNHLGALQNALLESKILPLLLSYSNWNTIANVIGLGLSQGIARYAYLEGNQKNNNKEAYNGYLELMLFTYIKDISYKIYGQRILKRKLNSDYNDIEAYLNFYKYLVKDNVFSEKEITDLICDILNNQIDFSIKAIEKMYKEVLKIEEIKVYNYHFPWYRVFEMDFNTKVLEKK